MIVKVCQVPPNSLKGTARNPIHFTPAMVDTGSLICVVIHLPNVERERENWIEAHTQRHSTEFNPQWSAAVFVTFIEHIGESKVPIALDFHAQPI